MDRPRRRKVAALLKGFVLGSGLICATPTIALAAERKSTMIATYTAAAMVTVVIGALLAALLLGLAVRIGWIRSKDEMLWRRQIRVAFGATFLMAALTPYVALNFSMTSLMPFVAISGLVIAAWGWGASQLETSDAS